MNRFLSKNSRLGQGAAILSVILVFAIAAPSLAGDHDGINGYSLRLKGKEFSADEGGAGGGPNGLAVELTDELVVPDSEPMEAFTFIVRAYVQWAFLWLR